MDGLMLYRQFLENIRDCVVNYDLESLEAKDYLSILSRVSDIDDMSYIDTILRNAGLDLSFISSDEFLHKPVELQGHLGEILVEEIFDDLTEEESEAYSEYLNGFISDEDEILSRFEDIFGKDNDAKITEDMLPKSAAPILSMDEILDKNKEILGNLFAGMTALSNVSADGVEDDAEDVDVSSLEFEEDEDVNASENTEDVEDSENISETDNLDAIEELEDLGDSDILTEIDNSEDSAEIDVSESIDNSNILLDDIDAQFADMEKQLNLAENIEQETELPETDIGESKDENAPIFKKLNTTFLDAEEAENEDIEDRESVIDSDEPSVKDEPSDTDADFELENYDINSKKSFSDFLDKEDSSSEDVDEEVSEEEDNVDDLYKLLDGRDLDREVSDMYSLDEQEDLTPARENPFKEATEYFLHGRRIKTGNRDIPDLKKLYKSKEKLIDMKEVTEIDDSIAKLLLAVEDGLNRLPGNSNGVIQRIKSSGKKLYGNLRVKDEEDQDDEE